VFLRTNGLGTLVLLEACRRHRVQKFLLASTSALYGAHNPTPYREDADTSRPLSPYAASKKAAECLAYTYHYLYGLDVVVLRYFTVYGPAGRPDMSVFRFIRQIAEGQPVLVYGDGSQQRDFTYVEDVARGTVAALELGGFEIINLGSDRPVSVLKLIEQIERLVGRQARLEYRPAQPADVPATWADIRRAKEKLGWTPQTTLEQGLAQTVAWYQQHRSWAARIDLGQ
jgi:nucleoside-diphosphate-sugar epimerase